MDTSLFKDTNAVIKYSLKRNNAINTCLIIQNKILYYSQPLSIYEYLKHYRHHCYHNQPKNYKNYSYNPVLYYHQKNLLKY